MEFKLMQPHHASQVAEIHIEGQPGTLLTKLGKQFLTTLYAEICSSEWGFGVVALDGDVVAGTGVLTISTKRLFRDLKRRKGIKLLLALTPQLLTHPQILRDVYQSWRYPAKMGASQQQSASDNGTGTGQNNEDAENKRRGDAEFLFIGVREQYQGQKVGSGVFDKSVDFCQERGVDYLLAIVEHSNWRLHQRASYRLARYGWRRIRQLELNGRLMDVVEIDLTRDLPPEQWGEGTLDPETLPENRQ